MLKKTKRKGINKTCTCDAYTFPHREGGGDCNEDLVCFHGHREPGHPDYDLEEDYCSDCNKERWAGQTINTIHSRTAPMIEGKALGILTRPAKWMQLDEYRNTISIRTRHAFQDSGLNLRLRLDDNAVISDFDTAEEYSLGDIMNHPGYVVVLAYTDGAASYRSIDQPKWSTVQMPTKELSVVLVEDMKTALETLRDIYDDIGMEVAYDDSFTAHLRPVTAPAKG